MKKLFLILLSLNGSILLAETKSIILENKTDNVIKVTVKDYTGKNYSPTSQPKINLNLGELSCAGDYAKLTMDIEIPEKSYWESIVGRNKDLIDSITVNGVALDKAILQAINSDIRKALDTNANKITIYLKKRPRPESWGEWAKAYAKDVVAEYVPALKTSKVPTFPYRMDEVKGK